MIPVRSGRILLVMFMCSRMIVVFSGRICLWWKVWSGLQYCRLEYEGIVRV